MMKLSSEFSAIISSTLNKRMRASLPLDRIVRLFASQDHDETWRLRGGASSNTRTFEHRDTLLFVFIALFSLLLITNNILPNFCSLLSSSLSPLLACSGWWPTDNLCITDKEANLVLQETPVLFNQ